MQRKRERCKKHKKKMMNDDNEDSTRADTTRNNMLACTAGAACFLACRSCTIGGT